MAVWSIVDYKEVQQTLRYDAEYYRPEYRENIIALREITSCPVVPLKDRLLSIGGGATPLGAQYPPTGIPFLRSQNIMPGYLDLSDVEYIEAEIHTKQLNRSQLQPGDVLMTITGFTYGKATYVPDDLGPANINQHSVRMAFTADLLPEYVATFLNCRYGKLQSDKLVTGITRPALNYVDIKSMLIPVLPLSQQHEVRDLAKQAEAARKESGALYAEAEALLLRELRLGSVALPTAKTYTASFTEVMAAERMDAEYYQPRYYALLALLQKTGAAGRLGNYLRSPVKRGVQPSYEAGGELPVIKSQHIGVRSIVLDDPDSRASAEFGQAPKNRRALVGYGDVLLNSTGVSTIGRCQPLLQNVTALADGHVAILRCGPALDPVYLSAFLNSPAGYMQTERAWTGSSGQIELRPDLVEEYTVWVAPMELQRTIRDMIETAQQLRESASGYLGAAQRRVEEFIQAS